MSSFPCTVLLLQTPPQSAIHLLATVYSDDSIALAVIIFSRASIAAIDPWTVTFVPGCRWGGGGEEEEEEAAHGDQRCPSNTKPKWIDLTSIHRLRSIGRGTDLLTYSAICWPTLKGASALNYFSGSFCRRVVNRGACARLNSGQECVFFSTPGFNGARLIFHSSWRRLKKIWGWL